MTPFRTGLCRLVSIQGFKSTRVFFAVPLFTLTFCASPVQAQTGTCQVSTQVVKLRAEGLTEPLGNVLFTCSGANPGAVITGNLSVFLPVSVTNRVDSKGFTSQAVVSIDTGLGLTPSGIPGSVSGSIITFNNVQLTAPASGTYRVQVSNILAALNQLGSSQPSAASQPLAVDLAAPFPINLTHVTVGTTTPALYATVAGAGIDCAGSLLPSTFSMTNLFAAGTSLASTRLTEGFASAFTVRSTGQDSGTRFVVNYTGFPANAQVYIPDFVAGSNAAVPTNGGDLGGSPAAGQYLPGSGTLLLARVVGADANGAGGLALPAPTGAAAVTLDSVTQISLTAGAGSVVYEVIDSNPAAVESAQFPTFIGITGPVTPAVAQESLSIGPVSTVTSASSTDPIPRFAATVPGSDCGLVGDCQASYFPRLNVPAGPIQLNAISGGAQLGDPGYIPVQNAGGGQLIWTVAVNYVNGSGWIRLEQPAVLAGNGSVRVFVAANQNLAPGTYNANIVIDAGQAGSDRIPVSLNVQAPPLPPPSTPPPAPTVTISKIVNAATFLPSPLVSGSVATLQGSGFSGKLVSVTVAGQTAAILFSSDTQINFQVPPGLGSSNSANVIVTVDGVSSAAVAAMLAPAYPVIFAHGIRNQDWSENTSSSPAGANSILQIFGTGIPAGATVTAQIGSQLNLIPQYAAPAPNVPGVQQVNVEVPTGLGSGISNLILCANISGQSYCSDPYQLAVD
jgi:uncharacterized protein (TIGR03437 family)